MMLQRKIYNRKFIEMLTLAWLIALPLICTAQERIAFTSDREGNHQIFVMATDGSNQINRSTSPETDFDPSINRTTNKIAFVRKYVDSQYILTMDVDGANELLYPLTSNALGPAYNPAGSLIAFYRTEDGDYQIFTLDVGLTTTVQLTNSGENLFPSFSPNGSKIAFSSTREGNFEIYMMDASGADQINLTNFATGSDVDPEFSPDGSKIVFASDRDGKFEIYIMESDGSNQVRLTDDTNVNRFPVFSPDGTRIAFVSGIGAAAIKVMDVDGSNLSVITVNDIEFLSKISWAGPAPIAPVISNASVTSQINEGETATLTMDIADADTADGLTLTIDWGDGSPGEIVPDVSPGPFELTHLYVDNPAGSSSGAYPINVLVSDGGLTASSSVAVTVNNVAPAFTCTPVGPYIFVINVETTVVCTFSDPGVLDTHVFTLTHPGVSSIDVDLGSQFSFTAVYASLGEKLMTLKISDNDGGSTTEAFHISVVLPEPPTAPTLLRVSSIAMTSMTIEWSDNSDNEDGFAIEACRNKGCTVYREIGRAGADVTNYTDVGLVANTQYYYRVRAYNLGGFSAYSNKASGKTLRK